MLADPLQAALESRGCTVLRNRAVSLDRDNGACGSSGSKTFTPRASAPRSRSAACNSRDPIVALSHNPDSANWLQNWGTKLVLSGHTHGGQIRIPLLGACPATAQPPLRAGAVPAPKQLPDVRQPRRGLPLPGASLLPPGAAVHRAAE